MKKFARPKTSLFLGLGIVYLLIYFPQMWAVKVGYTGSSIGSRVRGTSRAVFGFTVPVAFIIVPFAYQLEQTLHGLLRGLRINFYRGDGHTETFWLLAAILILPFFAVVWYVEYLVLLKIIAFM